MKFYTGFSGIEPEPTEREAEMAPVARSRHFLLLLQLLPQSGKEREMCCRTGHEDYTFSKGMSKRIKGKILTVIQPHRKIFIRRMDTFFHVSMEAWKVASLCVRFGSACGWAAPHLIRRVKNHFPTIFLPILQKVWQMGRKNCRIPLHEGSYHWCSLSKWRKC